MFEHSTSPKTCSECGAHLDSGERCDCTKREEVPVGAETPSNKNACEIKDTSSISDHNSNVNETDDLISRKALLEAISKEFNLDFGETLIDPYDFYDMVENAPTVNIGRR